MAAKYNGQTRTERHMMQMRDAESILFEDGLESITVRIGNKFLDCREGDELTIRHGDLIMFRGPIVGNEIGSEQTIYASVPHE